jgi:dTDP-4-dehydrorhamnose 3,5-epimerase
MRFTATPLAGLVIVDIDAIADGRGFFARTFCSAEFAKADLPIIYPQCNMSSNGTKGTLRGMHWQADPFSEGKLVRCTRGAIFDVALDLRVTSPTYRRWFGLELTADTSRALFIPTGFAHGYQTLADGTEVFYQVTESYRPELARGIRWNDPGFGIDWPIAKPILSSKDASYPDHVK